MKCHREYIFIFVRNNWAMRERKKEGKKVRWMDGRKKRNKERKRRRKDNKFNEQNKNKLRFINDPSD